tara:strand:+ start:767 stop:1459 length:693 start_codon:yes stop_codon:yes gene_type:complete
MNEQRTHIDLFSGIGGFALASNAAGFSTSVFCESDPYATRVLKRHWPTVPIIKDIREFDGTKWRGADLLTGGWPCQPWSQAGEQRGHADDRALWPEMLRVIKEARPNFVLAENVAGLINMALDDVLSQLEGEGYSTGTVVLPACSLNAPHRRDRVWIMAHANSERGCSRDAAGEDATDARQPSRCQEHGGWDIEPNVGRVAHGIPHRTHRLKALGNAIVPQVAYEILKQL